MLGFRQKCLTSRYRRRERRQITRTKPLARLARTFSKLHRAMLKRGVYLVPSHYEAMYTSMAHINANLATFHNSFAPQA